MPIKTLFTAAVLLVSMSMLGCGLPSHGSQSGLQTVEWQTYESPDGHISFEHPSNFRLSVVPRKDADAPQLALSMTGPDGTTGLTLILRVTDAAPDYCTYMLDMMLRQDYKPITEREPISRASAQGFRQEFREGSGRAADEVIALTLAAEPAHTHFTCSYRANNKQNMRPICERIAASLTLRP